MQSYKHLLLGHGPEYKMAGKRNVAIRMLLTFFLISQNIIQLESGYTLKLLAARAKKKKKKKYISRENKQEV